MTDYLRLADEAVRRVRDAKEFISTLEAHDHISTLLPAELEYTEAKGWAKHYAEDVREMVNVIRELHDRWEAQQEINKALHKSLKMSAERRVEAETQVSRLHTELEQAREALTKIEAEALDDEEDGYIRLETILDVARDALSTTEEKENE